MNSTQKKIIEAAEIEFADHGFGGASIREITRRADVNIAAINYHFGSKEDLFKEMVRYRIDPINEERLALLDQAEESNKAKPVPLEEIVDIIVRPLLNKLISEDQAGVHFLRAMGKGMGEEQSFMKDLFEDCMQEVLRRFIQALSFSLGKPSFAKVVYGMHFLACAMLGAMLQHTRLEYMGQGKIDTGNVEELVDQLVAFISGGLKAMVNMPSKTDTR